MNSQKFKSNPSRGKGKINNRRRLKVVVATQNNGKIREIREVLKGLDLRIYGLTDFPNIPEMEESPFSKRGARFKCVIALVSPDGREAIIEGSCKGRIGFKEKGKKGFGYDPLFILTKSGKTMAELSLKEKNKISH